jgi:serine/threonine protein kinase
VQLGINKETGQEVAIKTIKKSKIETEADLIRIRREVQIMSSVQHPNIIHIYEGECELDESGISGAIVFMNNSEIPPLGFRTDWHGCSPLLHSQAPIDHSEFVQGLIEMQNLDSPNYSE